MEFLLQPLTLLTFFPLLGVLVLFFVPSGNKNALRWVALGTSLVVFGLSLWVLSMFDLRDAFAIGTTEETSKTVEASDTVGNFSPNLDEFLSTSACANTMIRMAIDLVDRFLPEGTISVGQKVEIIHTAPSLLGVKVHYRIVLTGIDGNHLHFTFVGWDGLGEVCHGRHERVVVSQEILVSKARERAGFLAEA